MSLQKELIKIETNKAITYLQTINEKIEIAKIHVRNGAVKSADNQLKFAETLIDFFCELHKDSEIEFI